LDKILTIGGANMDILAKSRELFKMKDSNVGFVSSNVGGVGRNVAVSLSKLGYPVDLITAVPNSDFGEMIVADLTRHQVGTRLILRGDFADPIYVALEDHQGEMIGAVNHMETLEALDLKYLEALDIDFQSYCLVVSDTNITPEAIQWVAGMKKRPPLAVEGVSRYKVLKLRPVLSLIDLLKINEGEALSLTGRSTPEAALKSLVHQGVKEVHITLGSRGALAGNGLETIHVPAPALKTIRSVNQAGDTYFSGVIDGTVRGLALEEKIVHGQALAAKKMREG